MTANQPRYSDRCSARIRNARSNAARSAARAARRAGKRCPVCGETFTPRRRDARYCSARCRVRAHRAKADRERQRPIVIKEAHAGVNIDTAAAYTQLAISTLSRVDLIPEDEVRELLEKAENAVAQWTRIVEALRNEGRGRRP